MYEITRSEGQQLMKIDPSLVKRTCKGHHYYAMDTPRTSYLLRLIRSDMQRSEQNNVAKKER